MQSGRPFPGLGKGTYSKEEILAWLITTCRDHFGGHANKQVADLVEVDDDADSDSTCDLTNEEDGEEEEATEAHADTGVRAPSTLLLTRKPRTRHTQSLLTKGGMSDPLLSGEAGTMHVNDAECGFMKGALQEAERLRVQRRRQAEGSSQEVKLGEHAAARTVAASNVERQIEQRRQGGETSAKKLKKLPDDDRKSGPQELAADTDASRERGELVGHTNIHGMTLGVATDVEAVDKEVQKGGENGQPQTGVGKGNVREGAKGAMGELLAHTGSEGAVEGVGEDVQIKERGGEHDTVEEKEHGSSDGKEAERVDETSGEKKNADVVVQIADMEAEEKRLAAKEEEERTRAAERTRALASERARLSAARL
ncbi:unnamed protein product [Closterium sp. Naga37s-1]|nr:unnamed protein product [Closterium sp. Naga37s-1]